MNEVKAISDYAVCKKMDKDAAIAAGLYQTIGADIDDPYIEELKKLVVHQDAIDAVGSQIKVVYTPLHGTGNIPVRRVLKRTWLYQCLCGTGAGIAGWRFPYRFLSEPGGKGSLHFGTGIGKESGC